MLGGLFSGPAQDKVVITEFMAANTRGLTDRDREHSDWIELYNAGPAPVNLEGWFLTDNRAKLTKWRFRHAARRRGELLLVCLSEKAPRARGGALHHLYELNGEG